MEDEDTSLEELGLDLNKLTPRERWVIQDVYQGLAEGYDFDSKEHRSFSQRWGENYDKNIKAWNRAKNNLRKP